mmetsp:Transcript_51370/g.117095  ORF Transcript_51370/g.117095 Transcript_51370/m.117095 type:complete len:336 (-) Transcript_51370:1091-2098(-)
MALHVDLPFSVLRVGLGRHLALRSVVQNMGLGPLLPVLPSLRLLRLRAPPGRPRPRGSGVFLGARGCPSGGAGGGGGLCRGGGGLCRGGGGRHRGGGGRRLGGGSLCRGGGGLRRGGGGLRRGGGGLRLGGGSLCRGGGGLRRRGGGRLYPGLLTSGGRPLHRGRGAWGRRRRRRRSRPHRRLLVALPGGGLVHLLHRGLLGAAGRHALAGGLVPLAGGGVVHGLRGGLLVGAGRQAVAGGHGGAHHGGFGAAQLASLQAVVPDGLGLRGRVPPRCQHHVNALEPRPSLALVPLRIGELHRVRAVRDALGDLLDVLRRLGHGLGALEEVSQAKAL